MPADRLQLDELAEDQAAGQVLPLQFKEPPDHPLDRPAVRGGRDEARLVPGVLLRLDVVLDDERCVTERPQQADDLVHVDLAPGGQPRRPRGVALDHRVGLGQVVAVPEGRRVVDKSNTAGLQALIEEAVLLDGHHPAAVDAGDGPRLRGDAADGPVNVNPDEGVVVDQRPADRPAVADGGLAGVQVVGTSAVQRVEGVEDEHRTAYP
jgi:hypothetical protein